MMCCAKQHTSRITMQKDLFFGIIDIIPIKRIGIISPKVDRQ